MCGFCMKIWKIISIPKNKLNFCSIIDWILQKMENGHISKKIQFLLAYW
jgi:hypothetical protein